MLRCNSYCFAQVNVNQIIWFKIHRKLWLNNKNLFRSFFKFDHEPRKGFYMTVNSLLMKNNHFLSISSSDDRILQFGGRISFSWSKIIFLFIVPLKLMNWTKGLKAFHFYNRLTKTKSIKLQVFYDRIIIRSFNHRRSVKIEKTPTSFLVMVYFFFVWLLKYPLMSLYIQN